MGDKRIKQVNLELDRFQSLMGMKKKNKHERSLEIVEKLFLSESKELIDELASQ